MDKPNIIIILLDAVRAKNLSIYGYKRETTPFLEKIKGEFTIYNDAISASHWSLPSAASLFTGTYPSTHGVVQDASALSNRFTTLASLLRKNGYKTIGICPNPYISSETGLDAGFENFHGRGVDPFKNVLAQLRDKKGNIDDKTKKTKSSKNSILNKLVKKDVYKRFEWYIRGKMDKYAYRTNRKFFDEVNNINREKPFFSYLHYDEAHTPYVIPNKYRAYFQSDKSIFPWKINQDWVKYYVKNIDVSEKEFQALIDVYDGGIKYLDKMMYDVYLFLENKSLLENTMICILGDHGDHFGEHELYYHLFSLYDELIKIPMMIKYPYSDINVTEYNVVQNIDVFPTIIDILKIEDKNILNQMEGNSLFSDKIQNRDNKYAYSELLKPFGPKIIKYKDKLKKYDRFLFSIRSHYYKYIFSTDGDNKLYDLINDPNENINIINDRIDIGTKYEYIIKEWINKNKVNISMLHKKVCK